MVTPKGTAAVIAVSYHDTVNVLQAARADAGPFDRPEWFGLLADAGQRPLVAHANHRAALVLTRANGRIEPLRTWYSFTWRPLSEDPASLLAIARDLRRQSHRVTLWPVPDEDGSA